jgi:hypothetical protein
MVFKEAQLVKHATTHAIVTMVTANPHELKQA